MLEPDRDQLEIFIDAVLRRAGAEGYVSLRSFLSNNTFLKPIQTVKLNGFDLRYLTDVAVDQARRAANNPEPAVFCPPLAVFNGPEEWRAREIDLYKGLVLSVECDEHPDEARLALEEILGPATVIVRSGGQWVNSDGLAQDKLHLHWRLSRPAMGSDELRKLKGARRLATKLVGGDPTSIPAVHGLRWPGSWHRKATPRLCEIIDARPDIEIDLDAALAALTAAAPERPQANGQDQTGQPSDPSEWGAMIGELLAGRNLHSSITRLAAKYARSGMSSGAAVNHLRALMVLSSARTERPGDWKARYDDIPRAVEGAAEKYGSTATNQSAAPVPLGEWDAGDDIEPPPPRGWLLGNVFARTFLSSLIAEGGAGKTAVRVAQFLALATGRALTGEHVFQRCRVLIVSLEDDDKELRRRVLAARLRYNISAADVRGWLFLVAPRANVGKLIVLDPKGRPVRGALAAALEAVIVARKIDLVALDPFVKTHSVPENDNSLIDEVAQVLTDLAAKHNVAVDVPHHVRKGAADPGNADRGRGASAAKDAARLVYTLTTMTPEEAGAFGIPEDQRRLFVRIDSAKVNIAPPMAKAKWFKLVSEPLGNATDLYPNGDEVQTVEAWSPPGTWADLDLDLINHILTIIDGGLPDGNRYTDAPSAKERAAWKLVRQYAPGKTEKQAREMVRTWVKNGALVSIPYRNPVTRQINSGLRVGKERPGDVAT